MTTDIKIAQHAKLRPIEDIAKKAGFLSSEIELYGKYKAKILLSSIKRLSKRKDGKLILVTTTTPTPWGEGKTTTTIGLGQALTKAGRKAFICIREPSLGPVMGVKGGAAGGGYSQVLPMEDINLHFNGDMHMVTAAHNLLSAMIDNHIFHGNELNIDPSRIQWRRCMDMNDRALRTIKYNYKDVERVDGFDITAASEVMAILSLSKDLMDMKKRLSKIVIGFSKDGFPLTAGDLGSAGAMTLLLKEAIKPNLVQSIEGTPAFVHGGPFANIAHGCNSAISTKLALKTAQYVVTEAGFGSDLGAEKFFDIMCRDAGTRPDLVVLTVTIRALKRQGGVAKESLSKRDLPAVNVGLANLDRHLAGLFNFKVPVIVNINLRKEDIKEEVNIVLEHCRTIDVDVVVSDMWGKGGAGGKELASKVIDMTKKKNEFSYLYKPNEPLRNKIEAIAKKVYGADRVEYTNDALNDLVSIEHNFKHDLPVCMAKTQFSLTDDPQMVGAPKGFAITVRKLKVSAGAGFVVAYTGDIMTMPGLPKHPAAEKIDILADGEIKGLF